MNAQAIADAEAVAKEAKALKRAANAGNAPLVAEKTNALRAAIGTTFSKSKLILSF